MPQFTAVPEELKMLRQWVNWKYVRFDPTQANRKIPICSKSLKPANVNSPSTWTTFERAVQALCQNPQRLDGIGFVFTVDDPFVGIDLDRCLSPGTLQISELAKRALGTLKSYSEVSPSRCGIKCIVASDHCIVGRRDSRLGVEVYGSQRYFTLTGNLFGTNASLRNATAELSLLLDEWFPSPKNSQIRSFQALAMDQATDDEIIRRATEARNGSKFQRLWMGDASDYQHNASEADLGMCCILAFWCGPNPKQIDRLFRRSGLYRAKWDRKSANGLKSYAGDTINKAISAQSGAYYNWRKLLVRNSALAIECIG